MFLEVVCNNKTGLKVGIEVVDYHFCFADIDPLFTFLQVNDYVGISVTDKIHIF